MKDLIRYIKESEEADYLLWQVDQWFNQYQDERDEFINILMNCIQDHSINNIEKYVKETGKFKDNYQSFVTFILDDPNIIANKEIDYMYNLKQIIQQIINNKSSKNKYTKNEKS